VEIADAVRRMRAITGLTQSEFARRIAGVSPAALARIEAGAGNPRLDTLTKIGRSFGLAPRFVRVRGQKG
jgi:predicted transcriptional regulator